MPRPDSVTDATITGWRAEMAAQLVDPRHAPIHSLLELALVRKSERVAERAFYVSFWLEAELTAAGCPQALCGRICFANGQRMFHACDPWQTTQDTLDRYRRGEWDTPGFLLAVQLIKEATHAHS